MTELPTLLKIFGPVGGLAAFVVFILWRERVAERREYVAHLQKQIEDMNKLLQEKDVEIAKAHALWREAQVAHLRDLELSVATLEHSRAKKVPA